MFFFILYIYIFHCQPVKSWSLAHHPNLSNFQSLLPSFWTFLSHSSWRSNTLLSFSHSLFALLCNWKTPLWLAHSCDSLCTAFLDLTGHRFGPRIPVAHSSLPHQSEADLVFLLTGVRHSAAVNQWAISLAGIHSPVLLFSRPVLLTGRGGSRTWSHRKQVSLTCSLIHTWWSPSRFFTRNCSQPTAIALAGFHPLRCSLSLHSSCSHSRLGLHSVSSNHSTASLSCPVRIILSLQSTNQNHPLSQQSLAPNVGGFRVVKMKGGVNSCNTIPWTGHTPLAARHTRRFARTRSARNQRHCHSDRYCWGYHSYQIEASRTPTPCKLALSGRNRLGRRWDC